MRALSGDQALPRHGMRAQRPQHTGMAAGTGSGHTARPTAAQRPASVPFAAPLYSIQVMTASNRTVCRCLFTFCLAAA
ncbi:hypothetical protein ACCQ05_17685 [Xanthomonas sp. NCPPB 3582]|uniref:hypothetical protein n=1 Tax=Xanthomonas sp. NCPPB 3582 TaxID=487557 RepID=UPI003558276A